MFGNSFIFLPSSWQFYQCSFQFHIVPLLKNRWTGFTLQIIGLKHLLSLLFLVFQSCDHNVNTCGQRSSLFPKVITQLTCQITIARHSRWAQVSKASAATVLKRSNAFSGTVHKRFLAMCEELSGAAMDLSVAYDWLLIQQLKCHRHAIPRKRSHACGQTLAVGELADAVDASVPRRINPMVKELTERKYWSAC